MSAPPPAARDDPWRKETAWCLSGCAVYLAFMAAWVFYFYVRIRHTLTGGVFPYAVTILVFEFISCSSMVVHGLSLLRRRVPRKLEPGSPLPPREYIIRVGPSCPHVLQPFCSSHNKLSECPTVALMALIQQLQVLRLLACMGSMCLLQPFVPEAVPERQPHL